ncbi:LutC/YkgG family protein [Adhaeribacter aquaticus]|uniref:LutC/YkgG family protein n=1 Tax=Adhaeribacter aquaticus TaxID=299567 RepID=UPI0003FDAE56|nr:LUD domain-containing protein [Adhaeribacter aquaticus]
MNSREKILQAVLKNQPAASVLPDISMFGGNKSEAVQQYLEIFKTIGGTALEVADFAEIKTYLQDNFELTKRTVTTLPELGDMAEMLSQTVDPHTFEDVELAVIQGHLAVAENGAIWLTDEVMGQRIIPYICQHLAVVVSANQVVPTLHEAYAEIGIGNYGFGGFIGGPSKTADIEQALVLGAHGPLSMTVFLLTEMS